MAIAILQTSVFWARLLVALQQAPVFGEARGFIPRNDESDKAKGASPARGLPRLLREVGAASIEQKNVVLDRGIPRFHRGRLREFLPRGFKFPRSMWE